MTLDNYILENTINSTDLSDIWMEQAIAEFEVASAILDASLKDNLIYEYATEEVGDVYQEADGSSEKGAAFKEKMKTTGTNVKNFFKAAWKTILAAIDKFIDSLSHVNFKALAKKVEKNISDEATALDFDKTFFDKMDKSIAMIEELGDLRESANTADPGRHLEQLKAFEEKVKKTFDIKDPKKLKEILNKKPSDKKEDEEEYNPERCELTKSELLNLIKSCAELQSNIGGFRTQRRRLELQAFKPPKDSIDSVVKNAAEVKKLYTAITRMIANQFIEGAKNVKTMVNTILKGEKAVNKTNKKDPFYSSAENKNDDALENEALSGTLDNLIGGGSVADAELNARTAVQDARKRSDTRKMGKDYFDNRTAKDRATGFSKSGFKLNKSTIPNPGPVDPNYMDSESEIDWNAGSTSTADFKNRDKSGKVGPYNTTHDVNITGKPGSELKYRRYGGEQYVYDPSLEQ